MISPTTSEKEIPEFEAMLESQGTPLQRREPCVLQINTGKICNLTCIHCHVNAGPHRKEIISRETVDRILNWLERTEIETVDLTGGAPEMIPDFQYLVESLRKQGRHVIDRSNLTIFLEPGYEGYAEFLAKHQVEIIASMPCYSPENVNEQRGNGVFDTSIRALQLLNKLGYAHKAELPLHLVYNPNGAKLPPEQSELEADYKRELKNHFEIVFNNLYTITNLPIARFASYLKQNGQLQDYMQLLIENFNPRTVDGLMCRDTISVDWQGDVFDCDFNQQLGMNLENSQGALKVWDLDLDEWTGIPIRTGSHCYGCTAGHGSSCGGALD